MRSKVLLLAREPLVHFLLLGLLLFFLYAALGGSRDDRSIRVDDKVVAGLTKQFQATWQRPPTRPEVDALVQSYIRDEIFYREGVALGLDRDDPTIRRRVWQKFETVAEESEAAAPPTEAELNAWLNDHAGRYADPALISFEQVMIVPAQHRDSIEAALEWARKALAAGADPAEISASRMLPSRFELFPLDSVARDMGADFAAALPRLRQGQWEGPVRSGFGIHLVRIEKLLPGAVPSLDSVRNAVARDFEAARRTRAADSFFRRTKEDYRIELTAALPVEKAK